MTSRPGSDTTPEVLALQVEAWRRMTPEARVELAWEMSETARDLLRARLREEHPEWTEREIGLAIARVAQGSSPRVPGH